MATGYLGAGRATERRRDRACRAMSAAFAASGPFAHAVAASSDLPNAVMARDQPLEPHIVVEVDVPDGVEQRAHRLPPAGVGEQVVALGDDDVGAGRDLDGVGDGLLGRCGRIRAPWRRAGVRSRASRATYPATSNVSGAPMRSRRPSRTSVGLRQVEAVHRDEHGRLAQVGDESLGDRSTCPRRACPVMPIRMRRPACSALQLTSERPPGRQGLTAAAGWRPAPRRRAPR